MNSKTNLAKSWIYDSYTLMFWSVSGYKEPNISFWSLHIGRKQNSKIAFGFKSDKAVSNFTFCFLLSPLVSLFLLVFFFFTFCWAFVGFILVANSSAKAFRIIGLGEGKYRWFVEQDFHWEILGLLFMFFLHFLWSPWLNLAHSGMVWMTSPPFTS